MTIQSLDDYVAASKQIIPVMKFGNRTGKGDLQSMFDIVGIPGPGALAATNATNGVVPTDATAGYPTITNFAGGAVGYLTKVSIANTNANPSALLVYDRTYHLGALSGAASSVTVSSFPSMSGRAPGGSYAGFELWLECATAVGTAISVTVTYTNDVGTTGRTSTITPGSNYLLGSMWKFPLQGADLGVQSIQSVSWTGNSTGTFNICIMRLLCGPVGAMARNDMEFYDLFQTGMPIVFDSSALFFAHLGWTSGGIMTYEGYVEIASK